ncbi:MAG: hypothetical protein NVSMB18_27820 [Acetobacteraceae bacterium]
MSHDLSASGAPKVVFDMARALIGAGWHVLVLSPLDGPFRERLLGLGADVMIEPLVLAADPAVVALARNFDVVIGNTVLSWRLLPALAPFTRVFLYAHETGLVAELGAAEPGFAEALLSGDGVWSGSERSAAALRAVGVPALVLEYGVEALETPVAAVRGQGVSIAVLATIEPRKGQDLAVKAFPLLPPAIRARCRMRLHGRPHDPVFVGAITDLVAAEAQITIGPELDLQGYRQALAAADIVLCPSRDDTLPLISLDALAAGKVLICSREVGTAAYLEDGVSGFVLEANFPEEIASVLSRAVTERRRWGEIGEAARGVAREHFSARRFEERLLGLVGAGAELAVGAAD